MNKDEFYDWYPHKENAELWDEVTKLKKMAEAKNNSVKRLRIVGVEDSTLNYKGVSIEYVGRILIEGRDNYGWEVRDIMSSDDTTYYEVILYRDRVSTSEKDSWVMKSYHIKNTNSGIIRTEWGYDTIHSLELKDKDNLIRRIHKLSIGDR
jgi:hypothetical protein